jgi:hypothetical protein
MTTQKIDSTSSGVPKWPIAVALAATAVMAAVPLVVTDSFTLQVLLLAIMFGAPAGTWLAASWAAFHSGTASSWAWAATPPCCCCTI